MGRPYRGRRRRRPQRRLCYRGSGLPPPSYSFQDFGLKAFYDLLFPHIRGHQRRQLFNQASLGMALWLGVLGAVLGWGMAGPLGVIFGFIAAVVFGAEFLTRNRYYRP